MSNNALGIYICGPMSGIENFNECAFVKAETHIVENLFLDSTLAILNPAHLPGGLPQENYMDICLAMVRACSCIYVLKGWENSLGAQTEVTYAKKLGKSILFQEC